MAELPWQLITGPVAALALSIYVNVALWKEYKASRAELAELNIKFQDFLRRLTERADGGGSDA